MYGHIYRMVTRINSVAYRTPTYYSLTSLPDANNATTWSTFQKTSRIGHPLVRRRIAGRVAKFHPNARFYGTCVSTSSRF